MTGLSSAGSMAPRVRMGCLRSDAAGLDALPFVRVANRHRASVSSRVRISRGASTRRRVSSSACCQRFAFAAWCSATFSCRCRSSIMVARLGSDEAVRELTDEAAAIANTNQSRATRAAESRSVTDRASRFASEAHRRSRPRRGSRRVVRLAAGEVAQSDQTPAKGRRRGSLRRGPGRRVSSSVRPAHARSRNPDAATRAVRRDRRGVSRTTPISRSRIINETPIACGCGFAWNGEFEITWASALRSHSAISPNMLLYWELMARMGQAGVSLFNFGRCTKDSGTYRFKMQWGGREEPLWWYQLIRRPSATGEASTPSPDQGVFAIATRVWQRLPMPVANQLGPRIVRFIP